MTVYYDFIKRGNIKASIYSFIICQIMHFTEQPYDK